MRNTRRVWYWSTILVALLPSMALSAQEKELRGRYTKEVLPLLEEYCYDCHGDGAKKGEMALDSYSSFSDIAGDFDLWKRVWENLHRRNMPPADKSQPTDKETDQILSWVEKAVFDHDPQSVVPGHVIIRRLNRTEYQNTIRDLFGISLETKSLFPPDDTGHGFDTIGEVLTLSPLLMEKYLESAELVLDKAFGPLKGNLPKSSFTVSSIGGGNQHGNSRVLPSNGSFSVVAPIGLSGNYLVEVEASASRAGEGFAKMEVRAGKVFTQTLEVRAEHPSFKAYRFELPLEKMSTLEVRVSFTNDFYDPRNKDPKRRDRNLFVRKISIVPQDVLSQDCALRRKKLLGGQNDKDFSPEKVRLLLRKLLPRIYRLPLSESELSRHVDLFEASRNEKAGNFEALRVVLKAALVSPRFLFREEVRPSASDLPKAYPLDDFALANRLSYFLWSSLPDETLWQKAKSGTLRGNLEKEARRMIADPKTNAFIGNFTGQWLQLRDLEMSNPDRRRFPNFTDDLGSAMRKETEHFFAFLLRENRPVSEFLTADYTFSNRLLANYYKLEGKFENEFRKVFLNGINRKQRGGLLSHSSILTITSNPTRTSPVKRGRWVLDNLLGAPPKNPPSGVPELEEASKGRNEKLTLREQLAEHSRRPECSSCHANMDAMGFALENYDAVGRWRTSERGLPIDALGKLGTGERFSGPMELQEFIAEKKLSAFTRCLTEKLLTYGIGRGMEYYDRAAIEKIAQKAAKKESGLEDLIVDVVVSTPFTYTEGRSASSRDD